MGFSDIQLDELELDFIFEESLHKDILLLSVKSPEFKQKTMKDMILAISERNDSLVDDRYYNYLISRAKLTDL